MAVRAEVWEVPDLIPDHFPLRVKLHVKKGWHKCTGSAPCKGHLGGKRLSNEKIINKRR